MSLDMLQLDKDLDLTRYKAPRYTIHARQIYIIYIDKDFHKPTKSFARIISIKESLHNVCEYEYKCVNV